MYLWNDGVLSGNPQGLLGNSSVKARLTAVGRREAWEDKGKTRRIRMSSRLEKVGASGLFHL